MSLVVKSHKLHKRGNESRHYDDACAWNRQRDRFALADGAAESGFAGLWARMLVEQFVQCTTCGETEWTAWLPEVQNKWRTTIEAMNLPYYGEEQFLQGSFATFLGVILTDTAGSDHERADRARADRVPANRAPAMSAEQVDNLWAQGPLILDDDDESDSDDPEHRASPASAADLLASRPTLSTTRSADPAGRADGTGGGHWRAVAVGDSCLFQLRDGRLVDSFPIDDPAAFDNSPSLLGSRMSIAEVSGRRAVFRQGRTAKGDRLWLMSDALAQWFLIEFRAGRSPWQELDSLLRQSETEFATWVDHQRDERRLRNDDVTLLAVEL